MSGQGPQTAHKVRRNGSPSQRQGPIKAVKPFGINLRNSPSRSPSSPSHALFTQQGPRRSPVADSRHSPDRRSPGPSSPCSKVERPRPILVSPNTSQLRRTSSLDTIAGPYLRGHWPVDVGATLPPPQPQSFVRDETTQTPDEWPNPPPVVEDVSRTEKKKKKHRRSASFGHADKKLSNLNNIRQKLQKTKEVSSKHRSSPITANHNALLQTAPAVLMRASVAIAIPNATAHIPRSNMTRYQRNSVEGLSMEIKGLMMRDTTSTEEEIERQTEIPDGHRAPVPEVVSTRSVDTQTPSGTLSDQGSSSPASPANRPVSVSPATSFPLVLGLMDQSPRPSSSYDSSGSTPRDKYDKDTGGSDSISPDSLKKTASPKPNQIVREPPDGCERVTVVDEDRNKRPLIKEPLFTPPIKNERRFEPSPISAFCPLKKLYTSQGSSYRPSTPVVSVLEGQQSGLTTTS